MIFIKSQVLRLFVAVNLNNDIIDALCKACDNLKAKSKEGVFIRKENFHLTLAFIGETDRLKDIKGVLDGISFSPLEITLGKPGFFRRYGGDIHYISVLAGSLEGVAKDISDRLRNIGFNIENQPFVPHITLARQVILRDKEPVEVMPASMTVNRISLMKSERINGVLKYTEIYYKDADI